MRRECQIPSPPKGVHHAEEGARTIERSRGFHCICCDKLRCKSITGSEVTKPSRSENLVVSEAAKDAVTTKSQKLKSAVTPPARNAEMQLCVGGVNKSAQPVKPATALMSACAATMGMCGRR